MGYLLFIIYKKLLNILEARPREENAGELFKTPPLRAHMGWAGVNQIGAL